MCLPTQKHRGGLQTYSTSPMLRWPPWKAVGVAFPDCVLLSDLVSRAPQIVARQGAEQWCCWTRARDEDPATALREWRPNAHVRLRGDLLAGSGVRLHPAFLRRLGPRRFARSSTTNFLMPAAGESSR